MGLYVCVCSCVYVYVGDVCRGRGALPSPPPFSPSPLPPAPSIFPPTPLQHLCWHLQPPLWPMCPTAILAPPLIRQVPCKDRRAGAQQRHAVGIQALISPCPELQLHIAQRRVVDVRCHEQRAAPGGRGRAGRWPCTTLAPPDRRAVGLRGSSRQVVLQVEQGLQLQQHPQEQQLVYRLQVGVAAAGADDVGNLLAMACGITSHIATSAAQESGMHMRMGMDEKS